MGPGRAALASGGARRGSCLLGGFSVDTVFGDLRLPGGFKGLWGLGKGCSGFLGGAGIRRRHLWNGSWVGAGFPPIYLSTFFNVWPGERIGVGYFKTTGISFSI